MYKGHYMTSTQTINITGKWFKITMHFKIYILWFPQDGKFNDPSLVGGFNPSEKCWWNWIISPNRDEHKKYLKPFVTICRTYQVSWYLKPPPRYHLMYILVIHLPHQVTCWHLPQSVGRRHKRMKPMNERKATLDQWWRLEGWIRAWKIASRKISAWSWKLLTPKIDRWNTKDGRKSVVPLVPQFWAVQDASRNMTDTAVPNKDYALFNVDTNNQALQKVCLL